MSVKLLLCTSCYYVPKVAGGNSVVVAVAAVAIAAAGAGAGVGLRAGVAAAVAASLPRAEG